MIKNNKGSNLVLKKFNNLQSQFTKAYAQHTWLRIATNPLAIAGFIVIVLSFLGISGSSIGIYTAYFNDPADSGIVAGTPKAIRSDEWLVNSQMLMAQAEAGYPYVNENIGDGQNMSLVLDVPYLEWSVLLKPQNWIFFVAPFDFAFAFKWWIVLFTLFSGVYLLAYQLLPKSKRSISALIALVFCASPFVQWWLTPGTTLILGFSFLIAAALVRIHNIPKNKVKSKLLFSGILSYLIACFAVLLYPPFQIPCVLAIAVFYISLLLKYRSDKNTWKSLSYVIGAAAVALLVTGLYLITRWSDVQFILHTAYPGARVIESGGVPIVHVLSNFIAPLLQNIERIHLYTDNQSESSNFILPFVTILLVSVFTLWQYYKKYKKVNLPILLLVILFVVFLARMTVPLGDSLYKLFLLGSVPNLRLIIGLGVISAILLILNIRYILKEKEPYTTNQRWLIVLLNAIIYSTLLFALIGKNPGFIPSTTYALALLLMVTFVCWSLVNKKVILSLLVLVCFSFASIYNIHPLQQGTDILRANSLSQFIKSEHANNPQGRWIVDKQIQLENIPVVNGAPSTSGVFTIPQLDLFKSLVPNSNPDIYNRYAHVQYNVDTSATKAQINLLQADAFIVTINPCDPTLKKLNVEYILTTSTLESECTEQVFTSTTNVANPSQINTYKIK